MWKDLSAGLSAPISRFWPMATNAGTVGIARSERFGYHRAQVRHGERLRRDVAGVPVILMPGVQNEAKVGRLEGADEGAAVHYVCYALEALGDLDVVHRGVDRGKVLRTRSVRTPGSNGV